MCKSWKDGLCVMEVKVNFGVDIVELWNNIYMIFVYYCIDFFFMIFFDDIIIIMKINKIFNIIECCYFSVNIKICV